MPRIVKCPKCEVLLQEPPPGTPIYQCGNCSTTLRTKPVPVAHAPENAGEARPEQDLPWRRRSPSHDREQALAPAPAPAPESLAMRPASPYRDPAYYPAPGDQQGSAAPEGPSYSYNRFLNNSSLDHHRPAPLHRAYNPDAGAGSAPAPGYPNAAYNNASSARSAPNEPAQLPKSVRDKVFSTGRPGSPGFDFGLPRPYNGQQQQVAEHDEPLQFPQVQQVQVQPPAPQRSLRWKPRPDHEDAVPGLGQGPGPGLGLGREEEQQGELDRVADIYEAPGDAPDYEPSENSSSFSEPDANLECNSEVGLGTVPEYGVAKHDDAYATGLAARAAVPDSLQVPGPAWDGPLPLASPQVKNQLSPPAWMRAKQGPGPGQGQGQGQGQAQGHVQEPSVAMPSDLFRKGATEYRSTYDGPRLAAVQEHHLAGAAAAAAAAAAQGGYGSDYGVPEHQQVVMEPRIDTVLGQEVHPQHTPGVNEVNEVNPGVNEVHPQHTQQRAARGSVSPGASYSYRLNVLQPSEDLERSQDAVSSPNGHSKLHPPFPSLRDPPYVVCQHCLQLLVLPKALLQLPPTRMSQKVRCGSCNQISVYSVERPIVGGVSPSRFPVLDLGREPQLGPGGSGFGGFPSPVPGGSGFGGFPSPVRPPKGGLPAPVVDAGRRYPVAVDLPSPVRQLPSPTLGPSLKKGKEIFEEFRGSGSFDKSGSEQESPGMQGSFRSGSDSESDSVKNGPAFGNPNGPQDDPPESSTYPSAVTAGEEGRARNKVASIFKGFKDLTTKSGQGKIYRRQVFVNGRPIPDPLVRKAEESAGPIHPGNYWYDVHAGFWGVMGGPCQGIIPPFIEELNHPLPRDCSGGRTGVIVNNRDLHKVDLDILARRGLPTTPGVSYRVEIDGRVTAENTGQVLKSLGRLAPSVEKRGRGHGMVVK